MATVGYNSSDSLQAKFLQAIRSTESNGSYTVGYGGVDLSNYSTDAYGFPQWSGATTSSGPTHAAGAYQFQPATWSGVASQYGLNFKNSADQDAGAWYLAQSDYAKNTGRDLYTDLQEGNYTNIAAGLKTTWTSITGGSISAGMNSELSPGASTSPATSAASFLTDPVGTASAYFVRGGMILVGIVILGIALWALLSRANVLPEAVSLGK